MKFLKKILVILSVCAVGVAFALLAGCKQETATLTFDTKGGQTIAAVTAKKGSEYSLTQIPVYEGYAFEGWYMTADYSGAPITKVTLVGNTTVYAKWEQAYKVNFNLDGGSQSPAYIYLKKGATVLSAVAEYTPVKAGLQFGAWWLNGAELPETYKMPASEITLTAAYKVGYTIEIYQQNTTLDGYAKAENVTGYAYVNKPFTANATFTGFESVEHSDAVLSVESLTAQNNSFKQYFDREEYNLTLYLNANSLTPDAEITAHYGIPVTLPDNFERSGYCLTGWSASPSATTPDYAVDYISGVLVNDDNGSGIQVDEYVPEREEVLYAVWEKGYTDMYGGEDYIFLLDKESQRPVALYLWRGGKMFKGEYVPATGNFGFMDAPSQISNQMTGKLFTDGTFVFINQSMQETTAFRADVAGSDIDKDSYISFDGYNGITYSQLDPTYDPDTDATKKYVESKGTFSFDDNDVFTAVFTEGVLAGTTLQFIVEEATNSADPTQTYTVFIEKDDAATELGIIYGGNYNINKQFVADSSKPAMKLDGFRTLTMGYADGSTEEFEYAIDHEESIVKFTDAGGNEYVAQLEKVDSQYLYTIYFPEHSFNNISVAGGGTLTTNGFNTEATYTNGGTEVKGFYYASESLFGNQAGTYMVLHVYDFDSDTELAFKVSGEYQQEGNTFKVVYSAEQISLNYAEFYYTGSDGNLSVPILVIDANGANTAAVYGMDEAGNLILVSEGAYAEVETVAGQTKYEYTATDIKSVTVLDTPFNLTAIQKFTFGLDAVSTGYSLSYWYSYNDGAENDLTKKYEDTASGTNFTLIGIVALFAENNGTISFGLYSPLDGLDGYAAISTASGYKYIIVDEDAKTFVTLQEAPQYIYGYQNGVATQQTYMFVTGLGTVQYVQNGGAPIEGTVTANGTTTVFGNPVYTFTSASETFQFIQTTYNDNGLQVFLKYAEATRIISTDKGALRIDGYNFTAEFTHESGRSERGQYVVNGNEISFRSFQTGERYVFDVNGATVTMRGNEWGAYVVYYNQSANGTQITLDGYGNAKIIAGETLNGTYTVDGDFVTVTYTVATQPITLAFEIDQVNGNALYRALILLDDEAADTFVFEDDWSVYRLQNNGKAMRYLSDGTVENGTYVLVAENLLYYYSGFDKADNRLFYFDKATHAFTVDELDENGYYYYTADFDVLQFSKTGAMYFNGNDADTEFYTKVGNNVTVYRRPLSSIETVNKYGYVADTTISTFGASTLAYQGITYSAGNATLSFERDAQNANKYPIDFQNEQVKGNLIRLSFYPTGRIFRVAGVMTASFATDSGNQVKTFSCVVARQELTDGGYETFILYTVDDFTYYRLDISLTYNGETNLYQITQANYVVKVPDYNYWELFYQYGIGGQDPALAQNTFGVLEMVYQVTETGDFGNVYANLQIGKDSPMNVLLGEDEQEFVVTNAACTPPPQGDLGFVTFEKDDTVYTMYFTIASHQGLEGYGINGQGFQMYYTITTESKTVDGYDVAMQKVVASSVGIPAGSMMGIAGFAMGGEEVAITFMFSKSTGTGMAYTLVERTATETYYYVIEATTTDVTAVTKQTVSTYYAADDETTYADVYEGNVTVLCVDGKEVAVDSSSYEEGTSTYTVTVGEQTYTVKIEGANAVVTPVEAN